MNVQAIPSPKAMLDSVDPKTKKKADAAPGSISGTVDARTFTARLKLLKKYAETAHTIPILNYCAIEFQLGVRMKLSHYGLDMTMQATVEAEGTGAVCVPMASLLAFVAAANGDKLTMEKKPEDSFVTFTCGRYTARLVPLPIDDVPRLETPDVFARAFALGEGVLSHLLALAAPFVSTEEAPYYQNGGAFQFEADNRVRVVATDGHKLGTRATTAPAPLEAWDYTAIVPNSAIKAITGIIGKAQCIARFHAEHHEERKGKDGTIKAHAGWCPVAGQFDCAGFVITTKLIDGTFPDWRRVVPAPDPDAAKVTVATDDIARFSAVVRGFQNRACGVKVSQREDGEICFSFRDRDQIGNAVFDDGSVTAVADAEVDGTFEPIGLNVHYFATIAKALGTKKVEMTIKAGDPYHPFTLRGADGQESDFAVLMPMRV